MALPHDHIRKAFFESGKTLGEIAREVGVSRQRIDQIVYPEKQKARNAVAEALKSGLLVRPSLCSSCGTGVGQIEAHHPDYNDPLRVEWLCVSCHTPHKTRHGRRPARLEKHIERALQEAVRARACVICGSMLVGRRGKAITCSHECSIANKALRRATGGYEKFRLRQARSVLRRRKTQKPWKIAWAERVLAGGQPNRRYAVAGSRLAVALARRGHESSLLTSDQT